LGKALIRKPFPEGINPMGGVRPAGCARAGAIRRRCTVLWAALQRFLCMFQPFPPLPDLPARLSMPSQKTGSLFL
jgi:hypothetical protein